MSADDLLQRARAAGFTPGKRDLERLMEIYLSSRVEEEEKSAERALLRRADAIVPLALSRLPQAAQDGARARLARLIGRAAPQTGEQAGCAAALAALTADDSAQVRRQAALALGRIGGEAAEDVLLAAWQREQAPPVRRALAEALGKIGGARAATALAAAAPDAGDTQLARIVDRARLTVERTASRGAESTIDVAARPPEPVAVALSCRAGLERILADEAAERGLPVTAVTPGRVETVLAGSLESLLALRLHHRIAFPLAPQPGADIAAAVVGALLSDQATRVLRAFTRGQIRYRIAWAAGGHRRADVWRIARDVAASRPDLINDPTRSTWQVHIADGDGDARVELEPRGLADPRFAYRVEDVPAASHPTIAAALARLAVASSADPAADVVWDPFVGSALELIERARLAPARRLFGTDLDDAALVAARANLAAAGVAVELTRSDALTWAPPVRPTVMLTNPPMGRRVQRGRAEELLARMLDRTGQLLAPGGILVWISPWPGGTRARADQAGLDLVDARVIDMGGFAAEIQVFRARRPASARDRGRPSRAGSSRGARGSRRARSG